MSESRYRFGDRERRGMFGALRPGQVLSAVLGTAWAAAVIDLAPTGSGLVIALLGVGVAVAAVSVPVAGRTVEQWVPLLATAAVDGVLGRHTPQTTSSADGTIVALPHAHVAAVPKVRRPAPARPPDALGGLRLVEIPYRGRAIGAVSERGGRRLTLVLSGRAPGFALADEAEQQQRLSVWAAVLSGATRSAVRRISWVERTAPAQGDGLARWLHEQRDPDLPLNGPLGSSYLELMEHSAQAAREHEVLIAVQIDTGRLRKDGTARREEALIGAAERLARTLERARVQIDAALTVGGIARALRVGFDPYVGPQLAALRAGGAGDELSPASAWPAGTRAHWGHYRSDGAVHATYEVGGWPRADVGPAFLGSLLGASDFVRSVAVVFEPLDPLRSLRQAEYEVTRDETDRQTRQRFGQVETARQRQTAEVARLREAELAAGHAEVRLAGFVTVTAPDLEELESACQEVLTRAGRAHLELRRLYGQQAHAFTFTLPLCRGLR